MKYWNFHIPWLIGIFGVGNIFIYFNLISNDIFAIFLISFALGIWYQAYADSCGVKGESKK